MIPLSDWFPGPVPGSQVYVCGKWSIRHITEAYCGGVLCYTVNTSMVSFSAHFSDKVWPKVRKERYFPHFLYNHWVGKNSEDAENLSLGT